MKGYVNLRDNHYILRKSTIFSKRICYFCSDMEKTSKFILALLFIFTGTLAFGQFGRLNKKDSTAILGTPWIGIQYGLNWSGGDLKERFGLINHLGVMAGYKTPHNWVYGLDGNIMFGNKVKQPNMFAELTDSYGNITDENGDVGDVVVAMRGFNVNLMVGKVLRILSPNENSGIYVHGGVGYLQHRIRVETQDQVIPSLELKYRKGYDRYTTGINFHQFVGYAFLSNSGVINFYGGFYIQEGLTKNRRTVFFDEPDVPVDKSLRLDLQYGFKVGWFIPIYKRKPKEYYFD